jgi:aspartyl-tRNA(Asn)/glutamyl-tRNA(Gln) amidotransferase subunit C
MPIDLAEVRRIARLAQLEYPRVPDKDGNLVEPQEHLIADTELEKLSMDLGQILDHIKQLDEVNVEGVEPTSHAVALPTAFRKDDPREREDTQALLAAAPARSGDAIVVPKIVE